MQVPAVLQGELLKRLLQGGAGGAAVAIIVGFGWGGWSLPSTADRMAKERSDVAVVAALAPVCADKFRALPDAEAKTMALSKADSVEARRRIPQGTGDPPGTIIPKFRPCVCLLYAAACAEICRAPVTEPIGTVLRE